MTVGGLQETLLKRVCNRTSRLLPVTDNLKACDMPNKPMVPTAPTHHNGHPPGSLRRHIGRPLDSCERDKRVTSGDSTTGEDQTMSTSDNKRTLG